MIGKFHVKFLCLLLHLLGLHYSLSSNRMAIGFETPEDEKFYGFGERFGDCNQRGHRVGSWLEDGSFSLGIFDPDKWKLKVKFILTINLSILSLSLSVGT